MEVVYWARMKLAKPQFIATLEARCRCSHSDRGGRSLHDLPRRPFPGRRGAGAGRCNPAGLTPRKVVEAVSRPPMPIVVRWMCIFLTAWRRRLEIAGLPGRTSRSAIRPALFRRPCGRAFAMALFLLAMVRCLPVRHRTGRRPGEWLYCDNRSSWRLPRPLARHARWPFVGLCARSAAERSAKRARAFGMTIIGVSRRAPQDELPG